MPSGDAGTTASLYANAVRERTEISLLIVSNQEYRSCFQVLPILAWQRCTPLRLTAGRLTAKDTAAAA